MSGIVAAQTSPTSSYIVDGFNFYAAGSAVPINHPLRVMVVTSLRDISADDHIGSHVMVDDKSVYMKGALESLLEASNKGGPLESVIQIVGVMVDDIAGRDFIGPCNLLPHAGKPWIVPVDTIYRDQPLKDITFSLPSQFRAIPIVCKDQREKKKAAFEEAIVRRAHDLNVDIILSDHLMIRLEAVHHFIPTVNIHPAITNSESPYCRRGKTPSLDTLWAANEQGKTHTGASLHFINDSFDDGRVIADTDIVIVQSGWSLEKLKFEAYRQAKNPLVVAGLEHLANHYSGFCLDEGA